MAVEDHPRYQEWLLASDRRSEAQERFDTAVKNQRPEGEIKAAKQKLDEAQALYDFIADNIGEG